VVWTVVSYSVNLAFLKGWEVKARNLQNAELRNESIRGRGGYGGVTVGWLRGT
jgi:hypothetical protein